MKELLTILILIISVNLALCQASKVDTTFYPNGQVNTIDSIYDCDTMRLHKQFYADIVSIDSGTVYLGNSGWTQIESEGEYLLIGERSWTQHGKWTYWDKKGKIRLETISPNDGRGTIYINQWLPNGTQILKNGNGYYYQIGLERNTEYGLDSTVYEIKDSLKNGTYTVWCPQGNEQYYKCETGQYINNNQQPLQISFFENGKIQRLSEYENDRLTGEYHSFYDNGQYSQYGCYNEGLKTGNWKYWNRDGMLIKECNYHNGKLKGYFTEYYSNGHIRRTGEYAHITGKDTIYTVDIMTFEESMEIEETNDIPAKDGVWYYYDVNGNLSRIEKYRKGKLLKE